MQKGFQVRNQRLQSKRACVPTLGGPFMEFWVGTGKVFPEVAQKWTEALQIVWALQRASQLRVFNGIMWTLLACGDALIERRLIFLQPLTADDAESNVAAQFQRQAHQFDDL